MTVPDWFQIASLVAISLVLLADLFLVVWRPHLPSARESGLWVALYVGLALIFAGSIFLVGGDEFGAEFLAGWITEYSLSIDNLFVFVLILGSFRVPKKFQQEILMIGILLAVLFRGVFILIGAALIASFSWIFYVFGLFLLVIGVQQFFIRKADHSNGDSRLVTFLKSKLEMTEKFDGLRLRVELRGRKVWTPLLFVLVALAAADLLFAVDSIPAIYGITESPFIVFAANIFALMGLRQLYFLLGHLIDKLVYLHFGIAFILAFIGVKLVLHALHENSLPIINFGNPVDWAPIIGTWESLAVIVVAMLIAVTASLWKLRSNNPTSKADY